MSLPLEITLRNKTGALMDSRILFVGQQWLERNRGAEFCAIALDEHPKYHHADQVYLEALGRLRAPKARFRQIVSCGNLDMGETGVLKRFIARAREGDPLVDLILGGTRENTALGPEYIESMRGTLTRAQFAALVEGMVIRPTALYVPEFRRQRHLIPWTHRQCAGHSWAVGLDWGLQSAALVALVVRMAPDGEVWAEGTPGLGALPLGLVVVDEVVRDDLTTLEKLAAHVRTDVLPLWRRVTGTDPRAIVYDPAPGRAAREEVRKITQGASTPSWHYDQRDPDEKSAGNRGQRLRAWLDPVAGPPRIRFAGDLGSRPQSADRGICVSLESLERDMVRGDYTSDMRPGTRWEHAVDVLGYLAQWLERSTGTGTTTPVHLTHGR
jgi:hypothetical protein